MANDQAASATAGQSFNQVQEGALKIAQDIQAGDFSGLINEWILPYGSKIMLAIVIFYVGKILARNIGRLMGKAVWRSSKDEMLQSFVSSIAYFVLLLVVIIAALSQLGINTSSLVALIGAAGLAIGLSLQNSLQNFAAGVMILIFKPFAKGHYIEAGGVAGTVEQMGILVLELRTPDNKTVLVPNGKVFADSITNYSVNSTRRIDFIFDIAYQADVAKAKAVIERCLAEDGRILQEPEPTVAVGSLAASSVQLFVRPWVKTEDYWTVHFALTEKVKLALDEAGIQIPFNQLDIHLPQGMLPDQQTKADAQ